MTIDWYSKEGIVHWRKYKFGQAIRGSMYKDKRPNRVTFLASDMLEGGDKSYEYIVGEILLTLAPYKPEDIMITIEDIGSAEAEALSRKRMKFDRIKEEKEKMTFEQWWASKGRSMVPCNTVDLAREAWGARGILLDTLEMESSRVIVSKLAVMLDVVDVPGVVYKALIQRLDTGQRSPEAYTITIPKDVTTLQLCIHEGGPSEINIHRR